MNLTLTDRDRRLFARALREMVTLDAADPDDWELRVLRAVKPLVRADRAGFFYRDDDELPAGVADDYEMSFLADYARYYRDRDPGFHRVAATGMSVYSRPLLFRDDLTPLLRSECYNEFFAPADVEDSAGMILPPDDAGPPGFLALHRGDFGSDDFVRRGPALMTMLYPAFATGWQARRQLAAQLRELEAMIDALPAPTALYDRRGRLLHRNARLRTLLTAEPAATEVGAAIERAVARLRGTIDMDAGSPGAPLDALPGAPRARAGAGGPVVRAMLVDSLLPDPVVLVAVEAGAARPPSAAEIEERFGLTRRQAQVALLLADRKTRAEIAEALCISPHTAKRHTQTVLLKLGVGSRREVAGALVAVDAGTAPPGSNRAGRD